MWSSAEMFDPSITPNYSGTVCGVHQRGEAHPHRYLGSSNKQRVIFGPCLGRVLLTAISCCSVSQDEGPAIIS